MHASCRYDPACDLPCKKMLLVIPAGGSAGYFEARGEGVWLNHIEAIARLVLS